MSTRGPRGGPMRGYHRRKNVLSLDLNSIPPVESTDQEGTSAHEGSQHGEVSQQEASLVPALIDVDALDVPEDVVVLTSPRDFVEANNSMGVRGRTIVHDVETGKLEVQTTRLNCAWLNKRKRIPTNRTLINCEQYINLEASSNSKDSNGRRGRLQSRSAPPPPKEPTFSCPICMGSLVEEMSTKCGHIFCKACIKAAIGVQSKCPTCRKKVTAKDIIRVYLPTAS